ncbi:MAG: acyl-CoA thioesterase [Deltaproteobacteria bacterium]|nr:acyl-CoA thioesterase [Deltaproteobacteria bacterium]MBW2047762.1 acyl-CoA thioesterase [Deltaproteobacteria bacterium]MBW2109911.1 acyl-CoA thioesterase [Deltaproteobacteria bacterium]MBW2351866.1 acyl-CoA thioesterase [Deltaproteobacteria bacterium]HDZ91621.1 acyl-CoA thioesterase [Deltaproteobacteria bacterium]
MTDSDRRAYCQVRLTVPFHDLDPMNMVWHGNYLKYFDRARFALFDKYGIDLYTYSKETGHLFPIIKTSTKFVAPLRARDILLCKATVLDATVKIVMDFEIRVEGKGEICAKGRSEQVAVKFPEMEMMFEIPEEIRKALGF